MFDTLTLKFAHLECYQEMREIGASGSRCNVGKFSCLIVRQLTEDLR
jgi:hypothetical protein